MRETYFEEETLLGQAHSMHPLLNPPPSFQGFLLSTVPSLPQGPPGAQVPGAAHTKGMTNFSISQTPAAQAKRNPSDPEIVTPIPDKCTYSCEVVSLEYLRQGSQRQSSVGRVLA